MNPKNSEAALTFDVGRHGSFLATRDSGAETRYELEARVRQAAPVAMLRSAFHGGEALTYSFAEELIGSVYVQLAAGDVQADGVELVGLNEETRDAVTVCLERRKRLAVDGDEQVLVGDATVLAETYDIVRRLEEFRATEVADALGISVPNANNRLKRLVEAGAIRRDRSTGPEHGGKEFVYSVPTTDGSQPSVPAGG